ncbi:MAG: LysR family transcriptional regulator [Akkermansiaceae bacterium]
MNQIPDIRQIRIFIAIEETRSFTAAANMMSITQSAVSHSIKALESQLDCKLIERLGKKCILTPHGEVFLHHARQAVDHLEKASLKIQTLNQWGYSALKVGVSHSLCQYVIPKTLDAFYKKKTKAEVFITAGDTSALLKDLSKGTLDIAFGIHRSVHENDFRFVPLYKDELCFITSSDHPWCKKNNISEREYNSQRFITYGNDSATTQILNSHLSGLGIKQRASLTMCNMESIKEMTALGLGVGIIADWVARDAIQNNTLVKHKISPPPVRQWGYYVSKTKSLSLPEEQFTSILSDEFIKIINKS